MSANLNLFNWYKRYKVTAQDMTDFQEALVTQTRELGGGTFQGAVISGMDVTPVSGMVLSITAGQAVSATGYNCVKEVSETVTPTAASANLKRSLLVIRPTLVANTVITKPTSPFESVYLKVTQDCSYVIIDGTPSATPAYPSKQSEDVIVCGLRLYNGQTTMTDDDIDWRAREVPGKNGELAQRTFLQDDRLRTIRSSYKTLTIKPAQKLGKGVRAFSYGAKGSPSIYPKDSSGNFTNLDSVIDFSTGTFSGGDAKSSSFTPTIPTSNNSIVAIVALLPNDVIQVLYGTQGTRQQCLDSIKNQVFGTSAGNLPNVMIGQKLCYVTITSISGSIADIEVADVRCNQHRSEQMSFAPSNNQSSAADVSGFPKFNKNNAIRIKFNYLFLRRTDSASYLEDGTAVLMWNSESSAWSISRQGMGDDAGVDFSVTGTGVTNEYKLQYTSDSKSGANYAATGRISNVDVIYP